VLADGVGWWAFVLGGAGWLGLLLADGSDTVSRWGTPAARGQRPPVQPGPLAGTGGPTGRRGSARHRRGRAGRPARAWTTGCSETARASGFGGSRSTKTYNPITELGGQLRLPEPGVLLLRYRTDDPRPDYLRMTTLDRFDGGRWESSELSADLQDDAVQDGIPQPSGSSRVEALPITTRINPARLDAPWLPTPFPPSRIDVEARGSGTRTARRCSPPAPSSVTSRAPTSSRPPATPPRPSCCAARPLRRAASRVVRVPPVVSPYVAELIERTTAGAKTSYDKVAAIQELFRDRANGFEYSEDPSVPGFNAPDALENFLRGRRGFCEQYASAMAAMVRSLGIPARVGSRLHPGQAPGGRLLPRDDQRRPRVARGVVQRARAGCASSPPPAPPR
jgi:hypothetical protein